MGGNLEFFGRNPDVLRRERRRSDEVVFKALVVVEGTERHNLTTPEI